MPVPSFAPIESIQLVGGEERSGNVIINGFPICDDSWGPEAAAQVCRSLGFPGVEATTDRSHFGPVDQPFIATALVCTGQEDSLEECEWVVPQWPHSDCEPSEAAGVVCTGEPSPPSPSQTHFLCWRPSQR